MQPSTLCMEQPPPTKNANMMIQPRLCKTDSEKPLNALVFMLLLKLKGLDLLPSIRSADFCISRKFSGSAAVAGPGPTICNSCFKEHRFNQKV